MSKIFLFGIGGTGARVIKSLVMLAASGVDIQTDAIVPIIIDPDFANADLTRTIDVLKHYSSIRKKLDFNADRKNKFFKTDFHDVLNGYRFTIQHTHGKKYREFIQYDTLGRENKALASILFSGKNLDLDMELGFKGNPNIGSVVLNQFTENDDFTNFAAAFQPGDRIFIVSSIFGGTGASGFPLILKNIRSVPNNFPNCDALRKAPIGAISVLPYFDVKPMETSQIDSSTFISKTKAALHYYEKNVTGQNSSINVLYYVGDEKRKEYPNNEGGNTQRNLAHIVELAASLAIVDFASIQNDNPAMNCQIDIDRIFAPYPLFKEFGMDNDAQQLLFSDLSQQTRKIICAPMTQFALTAKYIQEEKRLKHSLSLPWTKDNKINETFFKSSFVSDFRFITDSYLDWLNEMSQNYRGFKPFKTDIPNRDLFNIVENYKPSKVKTRIGFFKKGYDLFDSFLDDNCSSVPKCSFEQKFTEIFYLSTKDLVSKKYKF